VPADEVRPQFTTPLTPTSTNIYTSVSQSNSKNISGPFSGEGTAVKVINHIKYFKGHILIKWSDMQAS